MRTISSGQILQISYMEQSNFCIWSEVTSCMGRSDFWWGRNDHNSQDDKISELGHTKKLACA